MGFCHHFWSKFDQLLGPIFANFYNWERLCEKGSRGRCSMFFGRRFVRYSPIHFKPHFRAFWDITSHARTLLYQKNPLVLGDTGGWSWNTCDSPSKSLQKSLHKVCKNRVEMLTKIGPKVMTEIMILLNRVSSLTFLFHNIFTSNIF